MPSAAVAVFDPNDPNTFNQATSLTLFDSLGATHTGTLYFVKTATANQWNTRLYIDGTAVGRRAARCSTRTPGCSPRRRRLAAVPAVHADHRRGAHERHVDLSQSTQFGATSP
jgi:flagellar hook protein FlgE